MTDPRIVSALREATGDQLREDAESLARLAVRVDRYNTPESASIIPPFPPDADTLRRLSGLALAVAEMQERGAFVDGGALPWQVSLGDSDQSEVTHPTLMSALAALLEGER